MHGEPPPVFTREPGVVTAGTMLFCALRRFVGDLGGHAIFIIQIISCWASIRWEGEMFHDLYEVELGFGHLRRD